MKRFTTGITDILHQAGVTVNGPQPWDPQVKNEAVYERMVKQGSLGIGESFMDEWWDVDHLDELVARVVGSNPRWEQLVTPGLIWTWLQAKLFNLQRPSRAYAVG